MNTVSISNETTCTSEARICRNVVFHMIDYNHFSNKCFFSDRFIRL